MCCDCEKKILGEMKIKKSYKKSRVCAKLCKYLQENDQ